MGLNACNLKMLLAKAIFCSLWVLGQSFDFLQMGFVQKKSVFEQVRFTSTILSCHGNCGDNYYNCMFEQCDRDAARSMKSVEDTVRNVRPIRDKPSLWSRFLYFISLGFLGEIEYERIAPEFHTKAPRQLSGNSNEERCIRNCTFVFRECYRKCICDENRNSIECNQIIKIFPQTFAPIANRRPKEIQAKQANADQGPYTFDWNNFL